MNDEKSIKPFELPDENDKEAIEKFKTSVEMVSPQKYVAEFDNNYKNLPEQGLIIMKIKVKNELVEAVQTEKKQNKTDQQNNIQNPEKSDSGIKNTEVVTTVKKTGQKTGIIIGGLSFLGAAMWLLYRKFHRKK